MRLLKLSARILVVSLFLVAIFSLVGCSESPASSSSPDQPESPGSSQPENPSNSGSSQPASSPDLSDMTYEERIYYTLQQHALKPANEQSNWIRKEGQAYVAHATQSGRLVDGSWRSNSEALNFCAYSMDKATYDHYMKVDGMCWVVFLSVPDDSYEGTDCVWDGTNLIYYPSNVNDKNTYFSRPGYVYDACVSPDGYLISGAWYKNSDVVKQDHHVQFDSFPYRGANRWNGTNLLYDGYHVVSSSDIMTFSQLKEYVSGTKDTNTWALLAKVDETGRIVDRQPGLASVYAVSKSKEEFEAWYREHTDYNAFFYEFPVYGNATDFIWTGSEFIYSPLKK